VGLISPADQQQLRDAFAVMTRPVRLLFFTQALECETCVQTRQILDELPALSDKIAIEEVNFVLDKDKAAQYGVDRVPAIAITYEETGRAAGDVGVAGDPGTPVNIGSSVASDAAPAQNGGSPAASGVSRDSRIRFLGAPAGYEFVSLVQAVLLAGGREPTLSAESRARLAAVDKPVTMRVFTTPT
jgi:alkyl hydroperoxide reductase subunit AhpF